MIGLQLQSDRRVRRGCELRCGGSCRGQDRGRSQYGQDAQSVWRSKGQQSPGTLKHAAILILSSGRLGARVIFPQARTLVGRRGYKSALRNSAPTNCLSLYLTQWKTAGATAPQTQAIAGFPGRRDTRPLVPQGPETFATVTCLPLHSVRRMRLSGCGGGIPSTNTPSGCTYTATVAATSGSHVHTATFHLTVQ